MVVSHATLLEIPLIAAGSDNRPISGRQNAEVIILRFRTLHCNTPLAAVCFGSDNLNISSEIDKTARHTAFPVNVGNSAGRIALGNSAEIDFHTFFGKTDGCVVFIVDDIVGIGEWKETFNRLIRRNRIIAGRKSPGIHDRIDCDVENTVCTVIQIQGAFQQTDRIFRQRSAAVRVNLCYFARLLAC